MPRRLALAAIALTLLAAGPLPARAEPADFIGLWEGVGEGEIGATIRRGKEKPDYLVIELGVGAPGCGGEVTVFGKENDGRIAAESYDPKTPDAPLCRVDLSLVGRQALRVDEVENCTTYHGAACGFTGNLTRKR